MEKRIKISLQKYTPSGIYNSKRCRLQKQMPNNGGLSLAITAQACDGIPGSHLQDVKEH